jgi:hypothetical protein
MPVATILFHAATERSLRRTLDLESGWRTPLVEMASTMWWTVELVHPSSLYLLTFSSYSCCAAVRDLTLRVPTPPTAFQPTSMKYSCLVVLFLT